MRHSLKRMLLSGASVVAIGLCAAAANSAPVVTDNHYEETKIKSCGAAAAECALPMTAVPAGKRLLVTRVSCSVSYSNGPPAFSYFQFGRKSVTNPAGVDQGTGPFNYLSPVLLPGAADIDLRLYAINAQPDLMFSAGQIPYFYQAINEGKFGIFTCTIIGTLTTPRAT